VISATKTIQQKEIVVTKTVKLRILLSKQEKGIPQKTTMRRAKTKQTRRQIVELIGAQVRNLAIPNRIQNLNKKANQKRMEDNNKIAHPNQPQAINQKRPNSKMVNRPMIATSLSRPQNQYTTMKT